MDDRKDYLVLAGEYDEDGTDWGWFSYSHGVIEPHGFDGGFRYSKWGIFLVENHVVIDRYRGGEPTDDIYLDESGLRDPTVIRLLFAHGMFNCLFVRNLGRWEQIREIKICEENPVTKGDYCFS